MILEISIIQLRPDGGADKPVSSAHDIIQSFCAHALTQEGARYAYFGRSSEQPNTMFVVIGWETLENSNKFASPPDGKDPLASLRQVANTEDAFAVLHVPFESSKDPSPALGADKRVGVTEVVLYYFPSPLTGKAAIMDSMDKMRPVIGRSEALAISDGWALEDKKNEKGEKCAVCINVVGWVDIDAHMRFQGSEDFKQNIHHLLGIESMLQLEMHHVHLHKV